MKKSLILAGMLVIGYANAQYEGKVGVNTREPKATLEINPNATNAKTTATSNEGILAPRLSKTRVANITAPVEGTLVYVTNETDSPISAYTGNDTKVERITEKGYYHYNGTQWVSNNDKNENIYNTNGTLSGDRTIEGNNKALKIRDLSFFGIGIKDLGSISVDMIGPIQQEGFLVEGIPFVSKKKIYSYDGFQSMSLEGNGDRPVVASADGTLKIGAATTGTGENIYNANGTLTGDRTVNGNNKTLTFKNTHFEITNSNNKSFIVGRSGMNRIETDFQLWGTYALFQDNVDIDKKLTVTQGVQVYSLNGTGDRNVVADKDGNLKIGNPVAKIRWVRSNDQSEAYLRESDNGNFVYVDVNNGVVAMAVPKSLPIGFSCVVVNKGTGKFFFDYYGDPKNARYGQSARGNSSRAQYSAVGIIKDTEDTYTITGDAIPY